MAKPGTPHSVRDYFDHRAHSWEKERQSYYSDEVRTEVLRRGNFDSNDLVIDYGSGSGYLTHALLSEGVTNIIAVDVSQRMLMELQRNYSNDIDVRIAEGGLIPSEDNAVNGLVANMVLHHLDDPALFFRECKRVLRHKGKIVVTDLAAYDALDFAQEQNDRWAGFELGDITKWMNDAGLGSVDVDLLGQRCCASVKSAKGGAEIFIASGIAP